MSKNVRSRRRPANVTDKSPTPSAKPAAEPDAGARDNDEQKEDAREVSERISDEHEPATGPMELLNAGSNAPNSDEPDHDERDLGAPNAPAPRDPPPPDRKDGEAAGGCSPDEERLEIVFIMTVLNWTQEEIAQYFKVVPRTVRNWQKKMANMTFSFVTNFDPAAELERALIKLTAAEVRLHNLSEDAAACSDPATEIRCARELARLTEQRIRLLDRVGGFDRLNLSHTDTEDAGKRRAESMFRMLEAIGASVKHRKDDPSPEDE